MNHNAPMSPLVVISMAFVSGAAVGQLAAAPWWSAPLCAAMTVGVCAWTARHGKRLALATAVSSFALGWAAVPEPSPCPPPPEAPCQRVVEGSVISDPLVLDGRTRLEIEMSACSSCLTDARVTSLRSTRGRLYLTVLGHRPPPVGKGAVIRIRGTLSRVATHANLGRDQARRQRALYTMLLSGEGPVSILEPSSPGLSTLMSGPRKIIGEFWDRAADARSAAIARALVLGESSALPAVDRETFRRTGTAHLLAVSGLHLGLVVALAFGLIRRLLASVPPLIERTDPGAIAAAITIPLVICFAALVGARPPVIRASVMAVCILAGRALGKRGAALESVSLAALVLTALDPGVIRTAGFQLSFAAVLGFILAARSRRDRRRMEPGSDGTTSLSRKVLRLLATWLRGSLAASAATTPFLLYHFDRISIASVPVNTLAVPLVTVVIMPALLATTLASFLVPDLALAAARPLGWILEAFVTGLEEISSLPITIEDPGPLASLGILAGCVAAFMLLARRYRTFAALAFACAAALWMASLLRPPAFERGLLTVDFLDVGQGDSTLITFPDGAHWLVDGGGTASDRMGEGHILPILAGLGVQRLDAIVLTHPDPDHVGGLASILSRLRPGELWDNRQGSEEGAHETYFALLEAAAKLGVAVHSPPSICGAREVGGARVEVIHPCHGDFPYDPALEFNDNSIVIRLSFEGRSVLLPGDLGAPGERILLDRAVALDSDVLKLGHHGSKHSTIPSFLEAVSPEAAVVSCGRWNRYGMPHRDVTDQLDLRDVVLYRTDLHGGVRIVLGRDEMVFSAALRGPRKVDGEGRIVVATDGPLVYGPSSQNGARP